MANFQTLQDILWYRNDFNRRIINLIYKNYSSTEFKNSNNLIVSIVSELKSMSIGIDQHFGIKINVCNAKELKIVVYEDTISRNGVQKRKHIDFEYNIQAVIKQIRKDKIESLIL